MTAPATARMGEEEFERAFVEARKYGGTGLDEWLPIIKAEARRARDAEEWQEQCRAIEEARTAALEAALRQIRDVPGAPTCTPNGYKCATCGWINAHQGWCPVGIAATALGPLLDTTGRREK